MFEILIVIFSLQNMILKSDGMEYHQCHTIFRPQDVIVDCQNLHLSALPSDIYENVTKLLLAHNNLTVPVFGKFVHLEYLDLSYNSIRKIDMNTFKNLTKLQYLNLNSNDLSLDYSSFPRGSMKDLFSLKVMNLLMIPRLSASYADETFADLFALEELYIKGILLEFGPGFANLTRLKKLTIAGDICYMPQGTISRKTLYAFRHADLTEISIHNCKVKDMEEGAFDFFRNLSTINLSCNKNLGLNRALKVIREVPNLETLVLDRMNEDNFQQYLTYTDTCPSNLTSIKRLSLRGNGINLLDLDIFNASCLGTLQHLNIGYNFFIVTSSFQTSIVISYNIKMVDISYYGFRQDSYNCYNEAEIEDYFRKPPVLPNSQFLTSPSISTGLSHYDPFPLNVEVMFLNNVAFTIKMKHLKLFNPNNSLRFIDLSNTKFGEVKYAPRYFPNLRGFQSENSHLSIFPDNFFEYTANMVYLNLRRNDLSAHNISNMLSFMKDLTYLDLSYCKIFSLKPDVFSPVKHLNVLNLSGNSLMQFQVSIMHMANLTSLDLSNNEIRQLTNSTTEEFNKIQSIAIDLSENVFDCDCESRPFIVWLQTTKTKLINRETYTCTYNKETFKVLQFDTLGLKCNTLMLSYVLTICLTPVALIAIVLIVFYQKRWFLRWHYHKIKNKLRKPNDGELIQDHVHKYAAFVVYNHEDDDEWISNRLQPKVEEEWDIALCIGKRDFIPGVSIPENIVNAIDNSAKTILFLTNGFLESYWCNYEMHMAITKGQNTLIMCLMENLDLANTSRVLYRLLRSTNFIEWGEDENAQNMFWNRLQTALVEGIQ